MAESYDCTKSGRTFNLFYTVFSHVNIHLILVRPLELYKVWFYYSKTTIVLDSTHFFFGSVTRLCHLETWLFLSLNDTYLYLSFQPEDLTVISAYLMDNSCWMNDLHLQLNLAKTELLMVSAKPSLLCDPADLPYTTPERSGPSYRSHTTPCLSSCSIQTGLL